MEIAVKDEKLSRQMNDRSLDNLKLGAQARYQGKIRRNTTLLPETIAWLEGQGNLSAAIDRLVDNARNILPGDTHNQISQEAKSMSGNTHNRKDYKNHDEAIIRSQAAKNQRLLTDVRILEKDLEAAKEEISQLRSQLAETKAELDQAHKSPAADLEATRDRYLASLRLGKQAPEYRRAKSVVDRFIAALRDGH